ncbi:hypothetical protein [Caulobacter sp. 17J80-11]|uniref:hypothetical protein n=1 Tax=Caulobacter sp. 17J80-11 TaxID=2763502 RepID=UPI001653C45C|nr:hypothetical protein [Caulobacter sp. 17J80-11]MBC6982582.1 hypothetical protein [Caulobacter sp. 17J80-11]
MTTARASAGGDFGTNPLAYAAMALIMAVLAVLVFQVGFKAASDRCTTRLETFRTEENGYRTVERTVCA